ncbi:hypothetical protein BGW36DRAFT_325936 [Talaromyces proteolyticus]|uniref:Uncharacterized protein n=1 Tax=Talaromyces proteolyticus TaxID=1131652 RepID=A0AAD4KPM1_9EURO|nr:uncharacterized protein BGW36DRAFT_325936 [Talaromyces proteolyticus]KAH8693171.1 hypothetical protein BGW36DRAFT_325936 [Talaromyces proteolyticus]
MAANQYGSQSIFIPNRFDAKERNTTDAKNLAHRNDAPLETPPSPTLTNPDMILPFENERESSTPSPPFRFTSSEHVSQTNNQSAGYHEPDYNNRGDPNLQPGGMGSNGNRPPRLRWTYEGHAPSRPLSDIGEEDLQALSPAVGGTFPKEARDVHHKDVDSSSDGSGSTISAGGGQLGWSAQDNQHLSVQPDSKRNSYASQSSIEAARAKASDALVSGVSQPEEDSSAILSSEAERILENAKKRLTLMEGNLTRARSSMRLTPSPSSLQLSPSPSGSLLPTRGLQPAGELYRSISQTDRRSSMYRARPVYATAQESGHSRGHSETNLSTALDPSASSLQPSRSLSALASFSASQYDINDNSPTSAGANGSSRPTSAYYQPKLDALREDDSHRTSHHESGSDYDSTAGLGISTRMPKISSIEDFNSAYPSEDPPSRAQSQLQVRDLKDQAAGLRTKVALLKVKTQEDNLRRRSLQSLRTPSPFTAAEQWYISAMEHEDASPSLSNNAGYGWISHSAADQAKDRSSSNENGYSSGDTTKEPSEEISERHQEMEDDFGIEDDALSILESTYEDAEEGDFYDEEIDRDALDRILKEPFDEDGENDVFQDFPSGPAPEATPHEDREDAFDYENFYLHSALGTYTRSRMKRRSHESTGSTETTRPSKDQGFNKHGRSGSGDSVSTLATFATATENAYSDYEDDEDNDAQHEIDRALAWDRENEDDIATPVQSRRATVVSRSDDSRNQAVHGNGMLTPPGSAARDVPSPATPVDAFMSSLSSSSSRPPSSLNSDDTRILEQIFDSLGRVCTELQELTLPDSDSKSDPKHIRTLRRRLDAARRVLDGQLD